MDYKLTQIYIDCLGLENIDFQRKLEDQSQNPLTRMAFEVSKVN